MPINGLTPISQNKDGYQMPINGLTLVSQNKDGYRMPINGLIPISQSKETWIPDANQWTYTSLLPYHGKQLPSNGLMLASSVDKTKCYKAKFMK